MFFKTGVLKNFAKFIAKLFNKVEDLKAMTQTRDFPVNIAKFLRISFYIGYLWRLLLYFAKTTMAQLENLR